MGAITNKTKNKLLHKNPEFALNAWQQMKGFMFRRPGKNAIVFIFEPVCRITLHMFFVFGPIDVLALDTEARVVALKKNLRPWRFWNAGLVAAIIELPPGTIAKTRTGIGDRISLPRYH